MIEKLHLKHVTIFLQAILSFVLSRKIIKSRTKIVFYQKEKKLEKTLDFLLPLVEHFCLFRGDRVKNQSNQNIQFSSLYVYLHFQKIATTIPIVVRSRHICFIQEILYPLWWVAVICLLLNKSISPKVVVLQSMHLRYT